MFDDLTDEEREFFRLHEEMHEKLCEEMRSRSSNEEIDAFINAILSVPTATLH
jgi:hypothetical protein